MLRMRAESGTVASREADPSLLLGEQGCVRLGEVLPLPRPEGRALSRSVTGPVLALAATAVLATFASAVPANSDRQEAQGKSELMESIRAKQRHDFESWAAFAFDRHVLRQRFDADNVAIRSETLEFEVSPKAGGFDEKLVRIDGRPPAAVEVRQHRQAGRFAKHYGRVRAGEDVDEKEGFSLAWLVQFPRYEITERERVNGWDCVRLDFGPHLVSDNGRGASRVPSRFVEVMEGSLWVERRTHHLVRAEARTLRPVPLSFGLVRILGLDVSVDAAPAARGVWLPTRISVDSRLSILGRDVHKRNVFTYSRYRRYESEGDSDSPMPDA